MTLKKHLLTAATALLLLIGSPASSQIIHQPTNPDARDVFYENATSGLTADEVQSAIDEIDATLDAHGLPEVLNIDNTSGANDLRMSSAQAITFGNGNSKIFNDDVDMMIVQTTDFFFKGATVFLQDDKLLFFSNVGNTVFKAIDGGTYFGPSRTITLPDLSGTIIVDIGPGGVAKNINTASFTANKGIDLNTWALLNSPSASMVELIGRDEEDDEAILPTTINIIGGIDNTSIGSRGGAVNLKWGSSLNGIQGQAGFFQDAAKIYSMDINSFKPESTGKDLGASGANNRWNIIYLDSTLNFATGMTIVRSTNDFLYNAVTSHQFQTGVVQTDNAVNRSVITVSSNTTLNATHHFVSVNTDSGNITITLPPLSKGREYHIKNIGSNNVIIDGDGAETIELSLMVTISPTGRPSAFIVANEGETDWEFH